MVPPPVARHRPHRALPQTASLPKAASPEPGWSAAEDTAKLIIMIPCLNEEDTLPQVLSSMPRRIDGVTDIETLIVDDGSTDDTNNVGLARVFQAGIDACLDLGADIIVNTDGDNQYPSEAIPALIEPVVHQPADITIGDRQTGTITEFSGTKKLLQRLGSWMVRRLSGVQDVPDAVSGFRAYSRFAASRVYLTARALDLHINYVVLLAAWAVIGLTGMLPISINGLGLREGILTVAVAGAGFNSGGAAPWACSGSSCRW